MKYPSEPLSAKAEELKKKYLYREMILKGMVQLPLGSARRLIGPDTAYHLYRLEYGRLHKRKNSE